MKNVDQKLDPDDDPAQVFSRTQVEQLARLVGIKRRRVKQFWRMLENAALNYFKQRVRQNRSSPSKLVKQLEKIEATCKKLIRLIRFCDYSPVGRQARYALLMQVEEWAEKDQLFPGLDAYLPSGYS